MNTPIRVFILAILLSVISIGMRQYTNHSIISQRKAHQSESTEAELQKKVDYVNNLLNDLYRADNYKNGTRNQRKELAGEILSRMEKDGYISQVYYDEDTRSYSFQYADGSLGGVSLKSFAAEEGKEPMN